MPYRFAPTVLNILAFGIFEDALVSALGVALQGEGLGGVGDGVAAWSVVLVGLLWNIVELLGELDVFVLARLIIVDDRVVLLRMAFIGGNSRSQQSANHSKLHILLKIIIKLLMKPF